MSRSIGKIRLWVLLFVLLQLVEDALKECEMMVFWSSDPECTSGAYGAFEGRGAVLCAAQVTERIRPGTVHSYEGSAIYDPTGEPGESTDRGGCINLLTSKRFIIEKSHSMASNSCLVQIERWEKADERP